MLNMPENPKESISLKWHHPAEVMKLHKFKKKKKTLQARIDNCNSSNLSKFDLLFSAGKRKTTFDGNSSSKRSKVDPINAGVELGDKIVCNTTNDDQIKEFNSCNDESNSIEVVKVQGKQWLPIDWSLKNKIRLLSSKPFPWNQKLKISEEASGVTAFTRCLDKNTETTLDISSNAKFYQCTLYWQQPSLPWLTLFPRNISKTQLSQCDFSANSIVKESLQKAYSDSLRSLFQLIRTGQCPYFYACANNFTVLFRAAGICGFSEIHAIITPTTSGFRKILLQEEIEYTMPLKSNCDIYSEIESNSLIEENEHDLTDDNWLESLGINDDDIRQINYTQSHLQQKSECQVDNSEQSTILIEGIEVHALYNFLINCRSSTSSTGPYADIPPTLLSPVAFHGASLNSLKIRENIVHNDDADYYSLELSGPILPSTIHNLFDISPPEHNMTLTYTTVKTTEPFSKLKNKEWESHSVNMGAVVFRKENLSDSGLSPNVLKHFCDPENHFLGNVECLKYSSDSKTFTWT